LEIVEERMGDENRLIEAHFLGALHLARAKIKYSTRKYKPD
jgi:hypothetical protein